MEPAVPAVNGMLQAVTSGITTVIGWIGTVINALLADGALNELLPLFAIGISISAILLGFRIMRGIIWGG